MVKNREMKKPSSIFANSQKVFSAGGLLAMMDYGGSGKATLLTALAFWKVVAGATTTAVTMANVLPIDW